MLDFHAVVELLHKAIMFAQEIVCFYFLGSEVSDKLGYLSINFLLFEILSNYRIKWVPHLMGDTGIYHRKYGVVRLFHIIKN